MIAVPALRVHTPHENCAWLRVRQPSGSNSSNSVIRVKKDPNLARE
jgi:hypothetical protein